MIVSTYASLSWSSALPNVSAKDSTHLVGKRARLPQQSGKLQRLPDSRLRKMHIHLLTVTRGSLERDWQFSTVHQNLTVDFSFGFSLSKHIHQGRFTGSGRTHECSESSSFAVSRNFVEELFIALDSVDDVFPGKHTLISASRQRRLTCWQQRHLCWILLPSFPSCQNFRPWVSRLSVSGQNLPPRLLARFHFWLKRV